MNLRLRLEKLELKTTPPAGGLPVIFILPDEDEDRPERAAVLADITRRQARGERVIVIGPGDDPLAALIEEVGA